MIFPFPDFIKYLKASPMTMALLLTNIFLYMVFFTNDQRTNYQTQLLSDEMLAYTGERYFEYIQTSSLDHGLWDLSKKYSADNPAQARKFAVLALKDNDFMQKVEGLTFHGDPVKLIYWKKLVRQFYDEYGSENLSRLGLSSYRQGVYNWISYQFSHAGFYHLFSNMIFLLLIGILLEKAVGAYAVALVYIIGGIVGGWFYLLAQSHTLVPVVGASGSISALMMFYIFVETKKRIRFFYFFSPFQGHHGIIYLSPFWILPTFFIADVVDWLSAADLSFEGVAHTAHIGGGITGMLMAVAFKSYLFFSRSKTTA